MGLPIDLQLSGGGRTTIATRLHLGLGGIHIINQVKILTAACSYTGDWWAGYWDWVLVLGFKGEDEP